MSWWSLCMWCFVFLGLIATRTYLSWYAKNITIAWHYTNDFKRELVETKIVIREYELDKNVPTKKVIKCMKQLPRRNDIFKINQLAENEFNRTNVHVDEKNENISVDQITKTINMNTTKYTSAEKEFKLILFYTKFFGSLPWFEWNVRKNYTEFCSCDFKECTYTYNVSKFKDSDVVLFHGRDIILEELMFLNDQRKEGQLWVYVSVEPPTTDFDLHHILNRYFDLIASYRLSSDIYLPYSYYTKKEPRKVSNDKRIINYAEGKTRQIAWIVSNCFQLRDKLASQLISYDLDIWVGGNCSSQFSPFHQLKTQNIMEEIQTFKFYFSAENSLCDDYITEKYWSNALGNGVIPITLGGADYANPRLAIPGSYINALDFETVKDLADYIKQVDTNDTLYNEYFKWTRYYDIFSINGLNGCFQFFCDLCTMVHSSKREKEIHISSRISNFKECAGKEQCYDEWVFS